MQSIRHYHLDLSDHYAVYPKAVAGYEQIVANNVELWINKIASEYCKSDDPANLAPLIGLLQFDSGTLPATIDWVGIFKALVYFESDTLSQYNLGSC